MFWGLVYGFLIWSFVVLFGFDVGILGFGDAIVVFTLFVGVWVLVWFLLFCFVVVGSGLSAFVALCLIVWLRCYMFVGWVCVWDCLEVWYNTGLMIVSLILDLYILGILGRLGIWFGWCCLRVVFWVVGCLLCCLGFVLFWVFGFPVFSVLLVLVVLVLLFFGFLWRLWAFT